MPLLLALSLLLILILLYFITTHWIYSYWSRRDVKSIPIKIPFGNLDNIFKNPRNIALQIQEFYEKTKTQRYGGFYAYFTPVLVLRDIDLIKDILGKDHSYFNSRGVYVNKQELLTQHLFALEGEEWKNIRANMVPTFSSGKIKNMFPKLLETTINLIEIVYKDLNKPFDAGKTFVRFTMDVIGTCGFGINPNCLKNQQSDFVKYGIKASKSISKLISLKRQLAAAFPNLFRKINISFFGTDVNDFFKTFVEEIINFREIKQDIRQDFLGIMIDIKNDKRKSKFNAEYSVLEEFDNNAIIAQSFIFFIAGFHTSASTMTFCLYELAKHQKIQDKVRDEINCALLNYNNKVCYEMLKELKYLQQVIDETLRLYPILPVLHRKCTKAYPIPNSDVVIEKNTAVLIPVYAIHKDPAYYLDPDRFNPENFNEVNKKTRNVYTYLPFGEGPRMCVGFRFGSMQIKVAMVEMLKRFRFTLNYNLNEPVHFQSSFLLSPDKKILLDVTDVLCK